MIISDNLYQCASTYLYTPIRILDIPMSEKEQKVIPVTSAHTGKRFNHYAANKATHGHIDISI